LTGVEFDVERAVKHAPSARQPPPTSSRSWVELTSEEQAKLLRDVRESQRKLAESVRLSQALVHFTAD
jgi:hypothetical protein